MPPLVEELRERGYCVLRDRFAKTAIEACREAVWPLLLAWIDKHRDNPNRGPHRHFMPMPFNQPCFAPEFFFDPEVLRIVRTTMDHRIVADQWGCDVALQGSEYQEAHIDFKRPLFAEAPDLPLPPYMLVVSFGLDYIGPIDGPIEILPRGEEKMCPVTLEKGDVLIRHPWVLHRGTPNRSSTPRALASIRYVRRWYADESRDVCAMPPNVWKALADEERFMMRFPPAIETPAGSPGSHQQ